MKKINKVLVAFVLVMLLLCNGAFAFAVTDENGISYDQVAGGNEMSTISEVDIEGLTPILGKDVKDGTYDITVKSSSAMFKIEKAVLTVKDGNMQVAMTMGGQGYLKVYMGTGSEAAEATLEDYIDFTEDENGAHVFTVPVEALDTPIAVTAFSKNKEKWYDRALLFESRNLSQENVLVDLPDYAALEKADRDKRIADMKAENEANEAKEPVELDLKDGEYTIDVKLEGGSGKSTVASPAILKVVDGKAYAIIEWSSPNYDYMKHNGEKLYPINTEGNSQFELAITALDEPIAVIGDTVAMSKPREIEYTLTFDSSSIPSESSNALPMVVCLAAVVIVIAIFVIRKKRKNG